LKNGFLINNNKTVTVKYLNSWDAWKEFKYSLRINNDVVVLKFDSDVRVLRGAALEFHPVVKVNEVVWSCKSETIPDKYLLVTVTQQGQPFCRNTNECPSINYK
jgi:hypothetical protein